MLWEIAVNTRKGERGVMWDGLTDERVLLSTRVSWVAWLTVTVAECSVDDSEMRRDGMSVGIVLPAGR